MRQTVIAVLLVVIAAATATAQTAKLNRLAPAPQTGRCDVGVVSHLEKFWVYGRSPRTDWAGTDRVPVESWHLWRGPCRHDQSCAWQTCGGAAHPPSRFGPHALHPLCLRHRRQRYAQRGRRVHRSWNRQFVSFHPACGHPGNGLRPPPVQGVGCSVAQLRHEQSFGLDVARPSGQCSAKYEAARSNTAIGCSEPEQALLGHYNLGLTPTLRELLLPGAHNGSP